MADIDILKQLSGRAPHWSPQEDYEQSQFDAEEEKKSMEALKSLMQQMPESVSSAGRSPAAERGPAIVSSETKVDDEKLVPKYDKPTREFLAPVYESAIQKLISGGQDTKVRTSSREETKGDKKTSFVRDGKPEKGATGSVIPEKLTAEQIEIKNIDKDISELESKRTAKRKEFEDYLDKSVEEMTKKPEAMGLMEVFGRSMLALAPGLIGAKLGGYRGGQYAQEGANKALEDLMKSDEARVEAANKIKSEALKLKAMLTKEDMDKIGEFQKDLSKGKVDLRLLPIKEKYELSKLLRTKELTKDDSARMLTLLVPFLEGRMKLGAVGEPPKGEKILSEDKTTKLYDGRYAFSELDIDRMGKPKYDAFVNKVSAVRSMRDEVGKLWALEKKFNGRPIDWPGEAQSEYKQRLSRVVSRAKEMENFGAALSAIEKDLLIGLVGKDPNLTVGQIVDKIFDRNVQSRIGSFMKSYQDELDISVQDRGGNVVRYGQGSKILTPEQRAELEAKIKQAEAAKGK